MEGNFYLILTNLAIFKHYFNFYLCHLSFLSLVTFTKIYLQNIREKNYKKILSKKPM